MLMGEKWVQGKEGIRQKYILYFFAIEIFTSKENQFVFLGMCRQRRIEPRIQMGTDFRWGNLGGGPCTQPLCYFKALAKEHTTAFKICPHLNWAWM